MTEIKVDASKVRSPDFVLDPGRLMGVRFFNRALLSRVALLGCLRQGFVVVWVTLLYAVGRGGSGALQAWVGAGGEPR